MPEYRVYYLKPTGKIDGTDSFEARTDDEAIILLRARKLPVTCEIWERDRLVATVSPRS